MRTRLVIAALATAWAAAAGAGVIATPSPRAVACGDANGDSRADMIVANGAAGKITIFLGDGSGGFGQRSELAIDGNASAVHLNESAKLILVANETKDVLTVFSPDRKRGGYSSWNAAVGDAPRDITIRSSALPKIKDAMVLATAGKGSQTISVFEACYGCTCTHHNIGSGSEPSAVVAVDVDGDGSEEIASANRASNDITIIRRDSVHGFGPVSSIDVGKHPVAIAAADLNGDEIPDFIVGGETLQIVFSDGAFGSARIVTVKGARDVRDLFITRLPGSTSEIVVADASGLSYLRDEKLVPIAAVVSTALCSADFNGDTLSDFAAVTNRGVELILSK